MQGKNTLTNLLIFTCYTEISYDISIVSSVAVLSQKDKIRI
jgi:hypothetical protein